MKGEINFSLPEAITPLIVSPSINQIGNLLFNKNSPPESRIDFLIFEIIRGSLSVPR